MANEQNLIPNSERTPSERRENARKAGKASGEARRRKKTLKEQMELLLSLPVKDESTKAFIESLGIDSDVINNSMAITLSMYQEALKGNTKAYELIRDTLGEKPTDKLQIEEPPVILFERKK